MGIPRKGRSWEASDKVHKMNIRLEHTNLRVHSPGRDEEGENKDKDRAKGPKLWRGDKGEYRP